LPAGRQGGLDEYPSTDCKGCLSKRYCIAAGGSPQDREPGFEKRGPPSGKRPGARRSKLDPFKPFIDQMLSEGVCNAVVILREIEQRGFRGEISIVRKYIAPKRPLRQSRATVRLNARALGLIYRRRERPGFTRRAGAGEYPRYETT